MSYGPVNRKTLASVNRVNRQVTDGLNQQFAGKDAHPTAALFERLDKDWGNPERIIEIIANKFSISIREATQAYNLWKQSSNDSDLQEPQDPGESNDNLSTTANTPMYEKLNTLAKKLYGIAYENLSEERQRAIREAVE